MALSVKRIRAKSRKLPLQDLTGVSNYSTTEQDRDCWCTSIQNNEGIVLALSFVAVTKNKRSDSRIKYFLLILYQLEMLILV
jgi:Tfp pilus assembly protein PilN